MIRLVECVPNFSEGRRPEVIKAIVEEITSVESVVLLGSEMDPDHNRAVVTFVCEPEHAVEACFRGIKKASELIDLQTHDGEHPRMGATDVCPFIPLADYTEAEAKALAHELGKRVGEELEIPVYLYEAARTRPDRENLAKIRKGEYEGMIKAIEKDPKRKPDYGPSKMHLQAGATAIGVRFPLVAFNVYLDTPRVSVAKKIADAIKHLRGGYRFCKAMGFMITERNQSQVSMNLVRYPKTPIFRVFETIKREAARYGVNVISSEIIGLVPQQALIDCADYYLQFENFSVDQVLEEKLRRIGCEAASVGSDFNNDVAAKTATPGGGSVAASAGAVGAALSSMVCRLTVGKPKYKKVKDELNAILDRSEELRAILQKMIIEDGDAFDQVMIARKLTQDNEAEIEKRNQAIIDATKGAALTPLKTAELAYEVMQLSKVVAEKGNVNSVSDAGVAALMAKAAVEGAVYNVKINLGGFEEEAFVKDLTAKALKLQADSDKLADEIRGIVESKI